MATPGVASNARLTLGEIRPSLSRSSSSNLSLFLSDSDADIATEEGLPHADIKLTARKYKKPAFTQSLLRILSLLNVPSWADSRIAPEAVRIEKVSGSLTNAVFFVRSTSSRRTLLLRVYGVSSGSLISRPRELHALHVLSSRYHIGPRIYGTFENGRVEEYFDSTPLTAADLSDETVSRWIGARMAEMHGVDIEAIEGTGWQLGAKKNVLSWLPPAREVLTLPSVTNATRRELDLDSFEEQWHKYMQWLDEWEKREGASKRVFCHNDTQYGNLLRLTKPKEGRSEHRQIIVVDFEYASPNPAAFDIANHFHEWTANYHSSTPHILDVSRYPTPEQRRNFYFAYLSHLGVPLASDKETEARRLEAEVRAWSPASHAMWAIWGIVQAREDLEGKDTEAEFDYIGYANSRLDGFRREIRALGVI